MPNDRTVAIRAMKFLVEDIDRVTGFYQNVFGFELEKTIQLEEVAQNVLRLPGSELRRALVRLGDEPVTPSSSHGPLVIETNDVRGLTDDVVKAGGAVTTGPVERPNLSLAMVTDPEGHSLELVHLPDGELDLSSLDLKDVMPTEK